jgi:uncharacterized membrane protein HdeD (DUF308 family)
MSLTLQAPPDAAPHNERAGLSRHWLLILALGVLSVVVGLVAIGSTFIATLASVKVFGALLLIAGVAEVIHAVLVRNLKGFALHLLAAALYLLVGLFILEHPIRAAEVLTLLLAASFIVGGLLRVVFSIALQFNAWQWVLLNRVVDLILGFLIWNEWPESSLWVIGLFVGIDLLLHGWSWVILALTVRDYKSAQPA